MGGGIGSVESSIRSTGNPRTPADEASSSSSSSGIGGAQGRLDDAQPIQLLVLLHRAINAELALLRRLVIAGAEEEEDTIQEDYSVVVDLRKRFEFLKQVYKYHCTAEDEVIFVALDARVKNIACTYSLEHQSIDDLFESIFTCLNVVLEKSGNAASEKFQELVFSVGALEKTMCRHMAKEEEQVFPLLMKHFTDSEQASLVWQFICSVPVTILLDLFPWLSCSLSADEHVVLKQCINKVVPDDNLLQELVISWLYAEKVQRSAANIQYDELVQCPAEPESVTANWESLELSFGENSQHTRERCLQTHVEGGPIKGLQLWHTVLQHDLKDIMDELYDIKKSSKYSSLNLVVVRVKFLAEVLFFYSNLLDKIIYPLIENMSGVPTSYEPFLHKQEVQNLQLMLYHGCQTSMSMLVFVEKLCSKMEYFVAGISNHFLFYETEVFPLITKKCSHEALKKILFTSLYMMPLGLLKCVTTWFSSQFPKDKLKSVLQSISQSAFLDKKFASLLHEWIRLGYSGKTSIEDLQDMFKSNTSYLSKQIKDEQHCRKPNDVLLDCLIGSFTSPQKHVVVYSGEINSRLFFPQISCLSDHLPESPVISSISSLEPKPMDHIYYFHKALEKELENIVLASNSAGEKFELLTDFQRRFHVMQSLYQLHTDSEDQIAFPALEAKHKTQNISQSYSLDHRLDVAYFNQISDITKEMSTLYQAAFGSSKDALSPEKLRYHQLSLRLRDCCRSLQKILVDHIKHEELEVWPLFREYFSVEEQERIIGCMLGRTRAEVLQELILWLLAFLTKEEQDAIMSFWRKASKDTMFDEWLEEWWDGMTESKPVRVQEESDNSSLKMEDIMEIVSKYLYAEDSIKISALNERAMTLQTDLDFSKVDDETKCLDKKHGNIEHKKLSGENKQPLATGTAVSDHKHFQSEKLWHMKKLLALSQGEMETIIRRISRDSSLDQDNQTRVIQCLMSSRWALIQQQSVTRDAILHDTDKLQGQFPSFRDDEKTIFGCKHYKTNCKLVAPCCNQIFTCRRCHDEASEDHQVDRKSISQMMCMRCLVIQPVGPLCTTPACENFSMSQRYCRICKIFDDEREIYHCPFCNICRLGKGLGIDFFHCMKCNACMSFYLSGHTCRQKCFEDVCPICHEDMFSSFIPVKALNCGHMMHSTCFQDYTCTHYICPVCSKSLGDMEVYFGMLDALLAEERLPEEYRGQTQAILCNDCERKGSAPFHWLHHKCSFCGSYNTRLV